MIPELQELLDIIWGTEEPKPKKKRPGVHSKNRNTKQKHGKYYAGPKYRGQGR